MSIDPPAASDVIGAADDRERTAVQAELRRANDRARRYLARREFAGRPRLAERMLARRGLLAFENVIGLYRGGGPRPHPCTVAWLLIALQHQGVRDCAWALMDPRYQRAHTRLWQDLTRLAPAGYAAAPAALLAISAWQGEDRELADAAMARALTDDPSYDLARRCRGLIAGRFPGSYAVPPPEPERIAAVYALTNPHARHDDPAAA